MIITVANNFKIYLKVPSFKEDLLIDIVASTCAQSPLSRSKRPERDRPGRDSFRALLIRQQYTMLKIEV